jgi:hypothetical protein
MSRSSYLRGKFNEKLVKINENSIFIFFLLECFLEIEKISLVGESQIVENFRLFPGNLK